MNPVTPITAAAEVNVRLSVQNKPLTAIQILEQELLKFIQQREQALAQIHAVEGAIQATQQMLGRLRAEVAKAEAEVKKLATEAAAEVAQVATAVQTEVQTVVKDAQDAL